MSIGQVARFAQVIAGGTVHVGDARNEESVRKRIRIQLTVAVLSSIAVVQADAATVPTPSISGPIAGPGMMYPNPPISIVPGATTVESFPYLTEEYFNRKSVV